MWSILINSVLEILKRVRRIVVEIRLTNRECQVLGIANKRLKMMRLVTKTSRLEPSEIWCMKGYLYATNK